MNTLQKDITKIQAILDADYNHEVPDVIRSKKFGRAFGTMLQHMFPNYQIIQSNDYCEASGFIKNTEGKLIYYASEDYRWRNWTRNILYRTAAHEKDWKGGSNNSCDLDELKEKVEKLFKRM